MNDKERMHAKRTSGSAGLGFWVGVVLCLALTAGLLNLSGILGTVPAQTAAVTAPVDTDPDTPRELSVTDLLKSILTIKYDMESAAEDMADGNLDLASVKFNNLKKKTSVIRTALDASLKAMGDSMSSLQEQLVNIQKLLDVVDVAVDDLLNPAIQMLKEHPISNLRVGDGLNVRMLCDYLDYADDLMPGIEHVVSMAQEADLSVVDSDGDLAEYLDSCNDLLDIYHSDPQVLTKLKGIFGAESDKLYIIAAQNSAEVRASGGFPGAIGTMQITDGVLTTGDFRKVYDVFATFTPAAANVTQTENRLFHHGLNAPRDADFCPDFERVASIFAMGYESKMGTQVDGVISMTPAILQKLLFAVDKEVILFDGMELNGANAAKALEHDLYFNYFGPTHVNNATIVTDQLFADAAKKAMQVVMENMGAEDLLSYASVAMECFSDRTLMLWSKDEAEQALIQKLGWSGGLNTDPQKPEAGVYFNCTIASKMGWFLIADTSIGDPTVNADGSCTYPITVTFSNDITQMEIQGAQSYITGGSNGTFTGSAYFFAPAGGTVGEFTASNSIYIQQDNYHDLDLGFVSSFSVYPGQQVTISYRVTTAPGVDTPLVISQTPTMQAYH